MCKDRPPDPGFTKFDNVSVHIYISTTQMPLKRRKGDISHFTSYKTLFQMNAQLA